MATLDKKSILKQAQGSRGIGFGKREQREDGGAESRMSNEQKKHIRMSNRIDYSLCESETQMCDPLVKAMVVGVCNSNADSNASSHVYMGMCLSASCTSVFMRTNRVFGPWE